MSRIGRVAQNDHDGQVALVSDAALASCAMARMGPKRLGFALRLFERVCQIDVQPLTAELSRRLAPSASLRLTHCPDCTTV